jgi:diadenosine tetraphosphate (Ap4A) HIT family hydrolase
MKKILVKVFSAQGFNYAWNEGDVAGQSVPHLHFHLIPRKEGDTGVWNYEPREFLYRPGSRESSPETELCAVSDLIKKEL